nr:MAG TPA: Protein of unknown function (DUF3212) [Caudoviricetes sp.]
MSNILYTNLLNLFFLYFHISIDYIISHIMGWTTSESILSYSLREIVVERFALCDFAADYPLS